MLYSVLKLIRWKNLLIIAFTQYFVRYFLIYGMLEFMNLGIVFQLSHFVFFLLCLSTILIAAAGYIINDYFDTKIDAFNKPDKVVVGKSISRRQAMFLHTVLNVIGVALGFYVGFKAGLIKLGFIHLLCTGLLWFYSTDFKKKLLIGNIITSLLTAMVPLIVLLYEIPPLVSKYKTILQFYHVNFNHIISFVLGYTAFAFFTTLIREIVKDTEDYLGDSQFGCNTLPIAFGVVHTKKIIYALALIEMVALAFLQYQQYSSADYISLIYFGLCFQLNFVVFIWMVKKAQKPSDYHKASSLLKLIMLAGVLYCAVYYYLLFK